MEAKKGSFEPFCILQHSITSNSLVQINKQTCYKYYNLYLS
jgi:hypothetical protein